MKDPSEILNALSDARELDHFLKLEGSCDSTECPAREFTVTVKDDDEMLLRLMARSRLRCPLCGSLASLRAVRTRKPRRTSEAGSSLQSVRW